MVTSNLKSLLVRPSIRRRKDGRNAKYVYLVGGSGVVSWLMGMARADSLTCSRIVGYMST